MVEYSEYASYLGPRNPCNFCGHTETETWGTRGIFNLDRCTRCGLVFINPRLNEEGLRRFYGTYFQNRAEDVALTRKREAMYRLEAAFLMSHIRHHRSLLDVGCGGGHFLSVFPDRLIKVGTEYDPKAVEHAVRCYGIPCYLGELCDLRIREKPVDVVIFRGVLEHVADPAATLIAAVDLLAPEGLLFITSTPDLDSICAEIYRGMWNMVGPDHLYYFNEKLLSDQLAPIGITFLARHHFYEETPYADPPSDVRRIKRALESMRRGHCPTETSPAFWGNMMTLLYRKNNPSTVRIS